MVNKSSCGVTQWSFDADPLKAARQAVAAGFCALHFEVGQAAISQDSWNEFKNYSQAHGLQLLAGSLNFLDALEVSSPEVQPHISACVDRALTTLANLKVAFLTVPFFGRSEIETADKFNAAARFIEHLSRLTAPMNIELMVECSLDEMKVLQLLSQSRADNASVLFDVQNIALWNIDLERYLAELGSRLGPFVHIKDGASGIMANRQLGTGDTQLSSKLPRLLSLNKKIVIETEYAEHRLDPLVDLQYMSELLC
jgi:2-epi-5-epi-valiolone 7-phosphate 2-epimerase